MSQVRDEHAYLAIVDDFVARRLGAAAFMAGFQRLWQRDRAECLDGLRPHGGEPDAPAALDGLLDSIDALCGTYARSLPAGGGYRVSEEQFRKEIESMTSRLPLAGGREA